MQVHLQIVGVADSDREEVVDLTNDLAEQLRDLDADVRRYQERRPTPTAAKGLDVGQLSELIVTVGDAPVLLALVECVRRSLRRPAAGKARIRIGDDEIELDGEPTDQQQELLLAFLGRHE